MEKKRILLYSEEWCTKHVPTGFWTMIQGKIYGRFDGLEIVIDLNTDSCEEVSLSGEIKVKGKNWLQTMSKVIYELKKIGLVPAIRPGREWEGNDYANVKI